MSLKLAADFLMEIEIRLFQRQDSDRIAQLFHQTVREVNIHDYSTAQVQAWAPDDLYFRNWAEVCSQRFTYVAEQAGMIVGFGELEFDGHIDCFYCHKNYQNRGVGRKIYQAIERKGLEFGLDRLFVEASVTAKPFFARMGFLMIREQQVSCRGEIFTNYAMTKQLSNSTIADHRP